MYDTFYSQSYATARHRFLDAAGTRGARWKTYVIDAQSQPNLAIDVAILGADDAPAVVVSSGVHGVEGFFGSAIQLALLNSLNGADDHPHIRYVLIHSLNPFGFAQLRRCNEDNVDLNRNFLASGADYAGAPNGYAALNRFLNPESPPTRFEPFRLWALWHKWRVGSQAIRETIARGQYDYPRGLFFGGNGPCRSTQLVQEHCDAWIASSPSVVHIDFHSGLGPFGTYKLLLTESPHAEHFNWYINAFGADRVEPFDKPDGTVYRISGLFGEWMQNHFIARNYRFVGAEFGTYDAVRVLSAIRAENRAYHYAKNSLLHQRAKDELLECFCPKSLAWRNQVVESGLRIIEEAVRVVS